MSLNGAVIVARPAVAAPFSLPLIDLRQEFMAGLPYRHIVIDDFLDEDVAKELAASFPPLSDSIWTRREHLHSHKLTLTALPEIAKAVVDDLYSPVIRNWLTVLTDIEGLEGDRTLFGGGLHASPRGGFLDIHADFSQHPDGRQRVLNLLLYLNEEWTWGGDLELWDAGVTQCLKTIAPVFNRAVIFETHDRSFHGHPEPLRCPQGIARKSLALYYYRQHRPWDVNVPTTDYRPRPHERWKRLRKWVARKLK